ncbi:MAG TPA: dihydroorotate dehydrogenase-like protein [Thermoanaerobaculia bacterium]|nr:dihydroorotate dehydrogenase-like protein [Thermoanaerobaculia bacterium]
MDLRTTYLGLPLAHPLMPGASPLVDDLDTVKRLEDAGASAIVMHSLFEEQISREREGINRAMDTQAESSPEAASYFPAPEEFHLGPDRYLEQIRKIRQAVSVPVIASLNGVTDSGWLSYAKLMQDAGAHALELNVYRIAADPTVPGTVIEHEVENILRSVKRGLGIPVAVKLPAFFTSFANVARQLDDLGADGLVLFNRFYQPDIDVELLEPVPALQLSDSSDLLLRLRWLAILSGRVRCSLAATGGVHTPLDLVKAIMAGANAVQIVSSILRHGPRQITALKQGLADWMEKHEYESVAQMTGAVSHRTSADPAAFERANYMRVLQSFRVAV